MKTLTYENLNYVRQFAHGGGGGEVSDLHLADTQDTWEWFDEDDDKKPKPENRFTVEVNYPLGSSSRSDWDRTTLSAHSTLDSAESAAAEHNATANAAALALVTLNIPSNLDPDKLDCDQGHEKRDGHAYKQTATVNYTTPEGIELTSKYTGMTHDLDGHRIDFNTANLQAAIDNLASHLDNWEFHEQDDPDEAPEPMTLRAYYITGKPEFD